jgi:hypothetical protein
MTGRVVEHKVAELGPSHDAPTTLSRKFWQNQ